MPLKEFDYISKKEGACYATHGHRGEHQVWSGGNREGKARPKDLYCVCGGKGKAGLGNSLELTSLSIVGSRVQGWSLVVWYLALGNVRQQKYWVNV